MDFVSEMMTSLRSSMTKQETKEAKNNLRIMIQCPNKRTTIHDLYETFSTTLDKMNASVCELELDQKWRILGYLPEEDLEYISNYFKSITKTKLNVDILVLID